MHVCTPVRAPVPGTVSLLAPTVLTLPCTLLPLWARLGAAASCYTVLTLICATQIGQHKGTHTHTEKPTQTLHKTISISSRAYIQEMQNVIVCATQLKLQLHTICTQVFNMLIMYNMKETMDSRLPSQTKISLLYQGLKVSYCPKFSSLMYYKYHWNQNMRKSMTYKVKANNYGDWPFVMS